MITPTDLQCDSPYLNQLSTGFASRINSRTHVCTRKYWPKVDISNDEMTCWVKFKNLSLGCRAAAVIT